jgi:hypothetical protein
VKTYVPPSAPPPPPPPTETVQVPTHTMTAPQTIITTPNPVAPAFTVPLPDLSAMTTDSKAAKIIPTAVKVPNHIAPARLTSIKSMEMQNWGRSLTNMLESGGDPHNVVANFPVYVAAYQNGDWSCNMHSTNGEITAGSMPDLVAKVNEWSHGSLKGHLEPTPLAIGGPDLLAKKPPFIFFTGHKDFKLSDTEIENLRSYLQDGGAIWGDNALAGSGSRFDVAFKREMRRVIPDADKDWQDVPLTDDLFRKSWFVIDKLPTGMNYYSEPIQRIEIDGKLAILYTPNDYSDLMFMHILPGDTEIGDIFPAPGQPLFTWAVFLRNSKVFFRNFTLPSALNAFRFGMNIVGHLLVRFDGEMLTAP